MPTENYKDYKSKSQRARVITESWVSNNMYCPICGQQSLLQFPANSPVADFFCPNCHSEYELKSQENRSLKQKIIPDGCYETMIERITSLNNPNLLVLTHYNNCVNNLIFIPKFFFVPQIIIKRQPLKENARRKGWTGCNINIGEVPNNAKISIISDGEVISEKDVIGYYNKLLSLKTENLRSRGWLMSILSYIDQIPSSTFSLNDVYAFEKDLKEKFPDNNFIKAKIRQQLQMLRNKGYIEFIARGIYKKRTGNLL